MVPRLVLAVLLFASAMPSADAASPIPPPGGLLMFRVPSGKQVC